MSSEPTIADTNRQIVVGNRTRCDPIWYIDLHIRLDMGTANDRMLKNGVEVVLNVESVPVLRDGQLVNHVVLARGTRPDAPGIIEHYIGNDRAVREQVDVALDL